MTTLALMEQHLDLRAVIQAATGLDLPVWPLYHLAQQEEVERWARLAAHLHLPFVGRLADIEGVRTDLNVSARQALSSAVIYIQVIEELTPQARQVGLTWHPLAATPLVALTPPSVWRLLFRLAFPVLQAGGQPAGAQGVRMAEDEARWYATLTREGEADPSWVMTPGQTADQLNLRRGIRTGSPLKEQLTSDAYRLMNEEFMRNVGVIPQRMTETHLILFMTDVENHTTIAHLERTFKRTVTPVAMTAEDCEAYWTRQMASEIPALLDEFWRQTEI